MSGTDISAVYWQFGVLRELAGFDSAGEARGFLEEGMFANRCSPVGVDVDGTLLSWNSDEPDTVVDDPRKEHDVVRG